VSRVEHIGDCTLYLGDCREILPTLGKVDAVVTDPPYGISYCHGARAGGRTMGTDGMSIVGDDKPFDPTPWLKFPCVLWGAEHFKSRLPDGGRWLVWNKRRPNIIRDQGCVENAWCSEPGVTRIIHIPWDGADTGTERVQRVHSNQKPIEVMSWSLGFVAHIVGVVLDPFMGSGTTGVACVKLGRKFIGIEIEPKYFEIACKRIEAATREPRLPLPEPKPKQEALI
jgi:site-specific DNA-methyltransferase (adenine-specific)